MEKDKKYYWIKLPRDFFQDKVMKKLRKLPGGEIYTIITLKILLLGLDNENRIFYDGVEETFSEEIATVLDEDSAAVDVTVKYLIGHGWLTQETNDTIYSPKAAELTGSESASAQRVRKHREKQKLLQCNTDVTECNTRDKRIEKDIKESIYSDKSSYISSSATPIEIGDGKNQESEQIFIEFPLLGGKTASIAESWCDEKQKIYGQGGVNVRFEIQRAIEWCKSNHLKKDWKKFLNNWFNNCLSKGGSKVPVEEKEPEEDEDSFEPCYHKSEEVLRMERQGQEAARMLLEKMQERLGRNNGKANNT